MGTTSCRGRVGDEPGTRRTRTWPRWTTTPTKEPSSVEDGRESVPRMAITDDQSQDVEELVALVKLVVEDSIKVPEMLSRLTSKVDANKIKGDKDRDVGLLRKRSVQEDGT